MSRDESAIRRESLETDGEALSYEMATTAARAAGDEVVESAHRGVQPQVRHAHALDEIGRHRHARSLSDPSLST